MLIYIFRLLVNEKNEYIVSGSKGNLLSSFNQYVRSDIYFEGILETFQTLRGRAESPYDWDD